MLYQSGRQVHAPVLEIGLQASDGMLTALAALVTVADRGLYFTGADAPALFTLTAAGRALLDDADASAQLTTLGVSTFIKTLLDDAAAVNARTTLGITEGNWNPTLTNTTNVASSTPSLSYYYRVGNSVTCWGSVTIDPTAGAALTVLGMTLPVASNLAIAQELAGVASSSLEHARIFGDTANDRATFTYTSAGTAATNFAFYFSYIVI